MDPPVTEERNLEEPVRGFADMLGKSDVECLKEDLALNAGVVALAHLCLSDLEAVSYQYRM